jgi:hypothetical protein
MSDSASSRTAERRSQEGTEWIPFMGIAERLSTSYRLVAQSRNGFIELAPGDVGFSSDRRVFVRRGAIVTHVEEPWYSDPGARPSLSELAATCPDGITCCVGRVQICCSDFRVIGSGAGSWGCQRRLFEP